ncbi:MAG: hypothetical protein WC378_15150 [Opitutaceae bacterium]|jgi:hypothetical protein
MEDAPDIIEIADLIAETLNHPANELLPAGTEAERQWELQMHRTDYEIMRISVLPVPQPVDTEGARATNLTTRGRVAENMEVQIGVQKKVSVTHTASMAGGEAEIRYHDKDECDDVARAALCIQRGLRRRGIAGTAGTIKIVDVKILSMGNHDHLQNFDVFTAILSLDIVTK